MSKTDFTTVDQYIAAQPEAMQRALERVREAVRRALPEAEESIAYRMPSYKVRGRGVLHFAGWKQHYALYFASQQVSAALRDELATYEVKKGTVRFPLSKPVPVKLIGRIAKFRAKEVVEREKAATAASV